MYNASLILEGGAMRGVFTSGVLDALMENGIEFKNVYGVSAGAKNSQYYVTGQKYQAIKVDLFATKDKKCMSVFNYIFKDGFIDQKYYDNYVLKEVAPIDMDKMQKSKINYYVGVTNCVTGQIEFYEKNDNVNFRDLIAASCSLPIVQKVIYLNGLPYLDGGCSINIPYHNALRRKEKMLVILTRDINYRAPKKSIALIAALEAKYRGKYPNLVEALINQNDRYNKEIEKINELEEKGQAFVIRPKDPVMVKRLERDQKKLNELYNEGYNMVYDNLEKIKDFFK